MERWMRAEGDGRVKNKLLIEDMMVKVKANAATKLVPISFTSVRMITVWRDTPPPAGLRLTLQFYQKAATVKSRENNRRQDPGRDRTRAETLVENVAGILVPGTEQTKWRQVAKRG